MLLSLCLFWSAQRGLAGDDAMAVESETNGESAATSTRRSTVGFWRTDIGPLKIFFLSNSGIGHGTYPQFDGHILLEIDSDNDLIGTWSQDGGSIRCESGDHSGVAAFRPKGEDRFIGLRWYCRDSIDASERWDGVLIAGRAWFNPDVWIGGPVRRPELDMRPSQAKTLMYRAHGDSFDPDDAEILVADMTCDGGLDYIYVWNDPAADVGVQLSVLHNQRPIYEGEDTSGSETVLLDGTAPGRLRQCNLETRQDLTLVELDERTAQSIGYATVAPTCSHILVGPGKCRIYWDLGQNAFGTD